MQTNISDYNTKFVYFCITIVNISVIDKIFAVVNNYCIFVNYFFIN